MGSGRGQVRRGRAGRPQLEAKPAVNIVAPAAADWQRWKRFVQENRLKWVNIGDYYQTEEATSVLTAAEIEATMQELFRDWVSTGALTLPAGRDVDEYEFEMRSGQVANNFDAENMVVFNDSKKGFSGIIFAGYQEALGVKLGAAMWKCVTQGLVEIMNGGGSITEVKDAAGIPVGF